MDDEEEEEEEVVVVEEENDDDDEDDALDPSDDILRIPFESFQEGPLLLFVSLFPPLMLSLKASSSVFVLTIGTTFELEFTSVNVNQFDSSSLLLTGPFNSSTCIFFYFIHLCKFQFKFKSIDPSGEFNLRIS